ncbi:MAG: helix-turn-helix transcriptional regulator [Bacteroidota bacterium]
MENISAPRLLSRGIYTGSVKNSIITEGITLNETEYVPERYEGGPHYHENPHITLVFLGGDVEERNGNAYERRAGEIFFYNAGEVHQTIFRTVTSKNLNIELEGDYLKNLGLSEGQISGSIAENHEVKFLTLKLLEELTIGDDSSKTSIDLLLLDLITCCARPLPNNLPYWARELRNVLNDRWSEQIPLNELSDTLGIHRITISKYFKKYFHCTYGEYTRRLKIDRSIPLVKDSKMSLTEVAVHCGFTDQSHFIKNFRKSTGFLPKNFRRR